MNQIDAQNVETTPTDYKKFTIFQKYMVIRLNEITFRK